MSLLSKIALPFVWLLSKSTAGMLRILGINTVDGNRVTEEEIKAIIQEGAAEGEIEEVEQDIVERVFNLSDRNVGSIMTHRSDMVWLDTNATCDQVEDIVKNNLFNTYPVADGNLDSIVGVVHLKDLFGRLDEPGFTLSQVMRPAQYIPENLSVYNALDLMRRTGGRYGLCLLYTSFSDEEAVRTRSGLESHEAVRRADVGQGRILGKGFAVGFDLRNVGCRNAERGRRIGRYLDRPRQTAAGPFPMAADHAVHRLIGRIDPLEPLREVGLHHNVFEARSRRVGLDTGQVFPVPVSYTHLDVYKRQPCTV